MTTSLIIGALCLALVLGLWRLFRSRAVPEGVSGGSWASCLRQGHCWHEGADTIHTLMGDPKGGFHFGTFTWVCLRCGARTAPEEAPPGDKRWDPAWVQPRKDAFGQPVPCYQTYRNWQRLKEQQGGSKSRISP